jgi:segregation and condensation protein A
MVRNVEKTFQLDNFEGPLDLLLHMIREKKMDLLEISLINIADQFVDYVQAAQRINLDVASEYLLIASQLVDMKSKHMLKTDIFQEKSEFEVSDEENLLERLIQYERYKKMSFELNELYENAPGYEKLEDDFIPYVEEEGERIVNILTNGNNDFERA